MNSPIKTLPPHAVYAALQNNPRARLIDVRTPGEFATVHAAPAELHPLDRIGNEPFGPLDDDAPLFVICKSGARAGQACAKLAATGRKGLVLVEGGTDAWVAAGLPVVRGKGTISLERQVRIAAGSLVLLGVGLGFLLHPACFGLSAFVGAGLVFAGLTDTCGMAMLLARMPWNR
jgi:rhodanese-related sulfurtransferase